MLIDGVGVDCPNGRYSVDRNWLIWLFNQSQTWYECQCCQMDLTMLAPPGSVSEILVNSLKVPILILSFCWKLCAFLGRIILG